VNTGQLKNALIIKSLAWASWALSHVGGWALVATFLGHWIAAIVGVLPDAVAPTVFLIGAFWMLLDVLLDGEPNRPAVWLAILLPSVAEAVHGRLGTAIHDWGSDLNRQASATLGDFIGAGSLTTVAIVAISLALILARRVVKKKTKTAVKQAPPVMAGGRV
jgi:hypothetical protein